MINFISGLILGLILGSLAMFAYLNDFYKKMGGK